MAESRLRSDAARAEVERVSDRKDGPYAGVHRFSALEFLARGEDHVPERYEVTVEVRGRLHDPPAGVVAAARGGAGASER